MTISFSDDNLALASWRNVQLALFTGPLLASHPAMVLRLRNEIVAKHPTGVFTFTSIVPNAGLPETAAREAGVAMLRTLNATERTATLIIEGSGIRMSAMRTVVTLMLMGARSSHPLKVFDAAPPAAAWLTREAHEQGCELPTAELVAAANSLRKQHLAKVALPNAVA